ncbi:MAG: metallophosphoesterase [Acidobacteriaceae bacterium]|nr:metallophosphoesterase [Acidobacteriaceae bacterium]
MRLISVAILVVVGGLLAGQAGHGTFRFVILGDRTGGAQPGVYEEAWREAEAEHPEFVISVGDTIEGEDDTKTNAEWRQINSVLRPYRKQPIFLTPGNHDVWSLSSARAFEQFAKRPLHYSFDYKQAHFVVLDNSRSEDLSPGEMTFLEKDLRANASQPVKFIFSHRPSWVMNAVLLNPDFPLERLAKQYGARYIIAGHIHQMLHFELEGITYLSMASSGGHLRASKRYEDGWFFQQTLATVSDGSVDFSIRELAAPFGQARVSKPSDWGAAGLIKR